MVLKSVEGDDVRTNYVLIDFENVKPGSLEQLAEDHFRLFLFVGANQTRLPFDLAEQIHQFGARAEYVKIVGSGSNALDFHIAFYIGQLATSDPSAYFHIVSKDTGFDPLVQYLKSRKILAGRVATVAEIPLLKAATPKPVGDRIDTTMDHLRKMKAARPRRLNTLSSTIASVFRKQLSEAEVSAIVQELINRKYVSLCDNKVTYALPAGSGLNHPNGQDARQRMQAGAD